MFKFDLKVEELWGMFVWVWSVFMICGGVVQVGVVFCNFLGRLRFMGYSIVFREKKSVFLND